MGNVAFARKGIILIVNYTKTGLGTTINVLTKINVLFYSVYGVETLKDVFTMADMIMRFMTIQIRLMKAGTTLKKSILLKTKMKIKYIMK